MKEFLKELRGGYGFANPTMPKNVAIILQDIIGNDMEKEVVVDYRAEHYGSAPDFESYYIWDVRGPVKVAPYKKWNISISPTEHGFTVVGHVG